MVPLVMGKQHAMHAERIPVLMYHRIGEVHNDWERSYCVRPAQFAQHMHALHQGGWTAITICAFFAWLDTGQSLPERVFLLTFDDGFAGIHQYAAPVLGELAWPATVFLVSDLIGQRDHWCATENPSAATYPLLSAEQILALQQQGFSFHSHTRRHADLTHLSRDELSDQLAGSRAALQDLLQRPVDFLAYPYGRFNADVIDAAREAGYRAAFSVQPGFNRREVDRFQLRRLDVFGSDSARALCRKVRLGSNDGSLAASLVYAAKRVTARLGL